MKNKYYAIFGVLFLLLSLGGAIYLSFQNADTQKNATNKICADIGDPKARQACADANGGDMNAPIEGANEILNLSRAACGPGDGKLGYWCDACGGFCTSGKSLTCDQAGIKKCGEYPVHGSTVTGVGSDCAPPAGGQSCNCSGTNVCFINTGQCIHSTGNGISDGLCAVWGLIGSPKTTAELNDKTLTTNNAIYFCKDKFLVENNNSCNTPAPANFNINCYCGTIQIDRGNGFTTESMSCKCDTPEKPTRTPTPTRIPTNTPTGTRTPTRTPTPTFIIITDTPVPTPTGTFYPTNTPIPTDTPVPTSTPVPAYLGCGYTPCDNAGKQCTSGLVCITANNSAQYCSLPQYTTTCATNPGYTGCCTAPVAQGPSPTRIILPISGVEFPSQALTIIGSIATLLGFLILL